MRLLRFTIALVASLAATLGVALVAQPASALSCIGPEAVAERAPVIVTGRILDSEDHRIMVGIHERWKGDLDVSPFWFEIDPTLDGWWDSIPGGNFPDGFRSKGLWLFMPTAESGTLQVNPCSAWPMTGPWKVDFPRPAKATTPTGKGIAPSPLAAVPEPISDRTDDSARPWLIGGAVAVIAAGAGYVVVRRLRTQLS